MPATLLFAYSHFIENDLIIKKDDDAITKNMHSTENSLVAGIIYSGQAFGGLFLTLFGYLYVNGDNDIVFEDEVIEGRYENYFDFSVAFRV